MYLLVSSLRKREVPKAQMPKIEKKMSTTLSQMTKHDINQHVYLTVIWFFILMADHPGRKEIKNLYINCALDFLIVRFLSNTMYT